MADKISASSIDDIELQSSVYHAPYKDVERNRKVKITIGKFATRLRLKEARESLICIYLSSQWMSYFFCIRL